MTSFVSIRVNIFLILVEVSKSDKVIQYECDLLRLVTATGNTSEESACVKNEFLF